MQKWPHYNTKVGKLPKMGPKKRLFSKRAQDFELLKQVPESSHLLDFFGRNQYIGTLILSQSAFPRIVRYIVFCGFPNHKSRKDKRSHRHHLQGSCFERKGVIAENRYCHSQSNICNIFGENWYPLVHSILYFLHHFLNDISFINF